MVAASAITATLTTLIMGTLSDRTRSRWGRRKPYILIGYLLWGLSTILFPMVAYIKTVSLGVLMVVLADSVMTFFGSTANDAAFNAWTADIATSETRGRVKGMLNLSLFLVQTISMAAAGILIDSFGYFIFFYNLGGIVILVGLVAGSFLKDAPVPESSIPRGSFLAEFAELLDPEVLKQNRRLFILLIFIMISSFGMQVSLPYLIVYLEHYVGVTKTQFSIIRRNGDGRQCRPGNSLRYSGRPVEQVRNDYPGDYYEYHWWNSAVLCPDPSPPGYDRAPLAGLLCGF